MVFGMTALLVGVVGIFYVRKRFGRKKQAAPAR
jgi:hypothetical protein